MAKYRWACCKSWMPYFIVLLLLHELPNGQLAQDMHCLELPATDFSDGAPVS